MVLVDEAFSSVLSSKLEDIHDHAFIDFLETVDALLGLKLLDTTPDISDDSKRLIIERSRAREQQDYQRSDEIRDELASSGISVRDTPSGSVWEYTA
jgi:cysteinyl-tRNA synthetase